MFRPKFSRPPPCREANLRVTISAVSRLLSSSCPPLRPKLTAPVVISAPVCRLSPISNESSPSLTGIDPYPPSSLSSLPHSSLSSPPLSSFPSSSLSSLPHSSLPPSSLPPSSLFSLPPSSTSSHPTRVTTLQRRIVRLQLAVKVCEARRAKRTKFLAHSKACWHTLRTSPQPKALWHTLRQTSPQPKGSWHTLRQTSPQDRHRNLTLVNYPPKARQHLSLSIGRRTRANHQEDKTNSRLKTLTFCKFYNMTGTCRRGDDCPFYHDPYRALRAPRPAPSNRCEGDKQDQPRRDCQMQELSERDRTQSSTLYHEPVDGEYLPLCSAPPSDKRRGRHYVMEGEDVHDEGDDQWLAD
eukprot:GHVS01006842.1.p1 GENE.GHVS01006842.1~~GHVS01006842.1.p1  ORF type:complete len:354 (+),score=72.54 GHVS01006842.1:34-1095(+)